MPIGQGRIAQISTDTLMSCSCNCSPCSCSPQPVTCCNPTTESVQYTFENQGLSGVGVFDNDTDYLVGFRTIASESLSLTVTLDAPNKTIVLNFDDTQLVADLPDATTTQRGILETATDPEAVAKALDNKIITPSNLAALGGTTSFAGFLELATNAETITGTDTARATTPAGVAAAAALYKTVTFADAVARAAATPGFEGQFAMQIDTNQAYVADGSTIGDWTPLFTFGITNNLLASTTVNLNTFTITYLGNGNLIWNQVDMEIVAGELRMSDDALRLGYTAGASQVVDFANALFEFEGAAIGQAALLGNNGLSEVEFYNLNTFLSNSNTQVYGMPSGTLARTTFATYGGQVISNPPTQAEVQAIDDAVVILSQRLGAVITDLMNTLKPHAT